nr:MAG TPA: hypothetical protein [Caudoviricetes sp.]
MRNTLTVRDLKSPSYKTPSEIRTAFQSYVYFLSTVK